MKKLNVVMLAACPFPADRGTPSRILGMAEGLAKVGHNIDVVTYHFGTDRPTSGINIHRIPRIPYHYLGPGPTFSKFAILDPLMLLKSILIQRTKKFDIIHAHHFEGAIAAYLLRRLTGMKVIYDAHTTLTSEMSTYRLPNIPLLSRYLDRKVPQWADHVVTVSDTLRDFILDTGVSEDRIDVIPTGVNIKDFQTAGSDVIRERYGLKGKRIIMYTGSLAPFQRVDYLFEAMKRVFEECKDVALILAVNSNEKIADHVRIENDLKGRVILCNLKGFDEVPLFLSAADVVVSPRTECAGIPQKLTNYMVSKKAIVSFRGSAKLLIDGVNGLIVEDGDVQGLAKAITYLISNRNLRKKLGENAFNTIVNRYDWSSLSKELETIYYQLLGY